MTWFGRRVYELRGFHVWWSDRFGICNPIVASLGGPLGHENDPVPKDQKLKIKRRLGLA